MIFYKGENSQIHESYLIKNYKLIFAIRFILFAIVNGIWWTQIYNSDNQKYSLLYILTNLKYLTLWGCNVVNLYFILVIIDMIRYIVTKKKFEMLWKLEHFLFQTGFSIEITIFLLYWLAVYPSVSQQNKDSEWYMFTTICYHGIVFFCIYIEFIINNIAMKWKHFLMIVVWAFLYLLVNIIVTLNDKPVYKVMDWVTVKSYIFAAVAILVTFLHFSFGKLIYDRVKFKRILINNRIQEIQIAQINPEKNEFNQEQQTAEVNSNKQSKDSHQSPLSQQ